MRASHCSVSSFGHADMHASASPPAPGQPAAAQRAARPRPRWQGSCLRACHSLPPSAARLATRHAGRVSPPRATTAAAAAALTAHGSMTGLAPQAGLPTARAFVSSARTQQNSDWCNAQFGLALRQNKRWCRGGSEGGVRKSNSSARFWTQFWCIDVRSNHCVLMDLPACHSVCDACTGSAHGHNESYTS